MLHSHEAAIHDNIKRLDDSASELVFANGDEGGCPAHHVVDPGKSLGRRYLMNFSQLFRNIPNLITLARLLMTPLAISMIVSQRFFAAFMIFLLAGVSDAVDGFIARKFNLRTELGAYLDPLADKALLISIYVSLSAYAGLPAWLTIVVVSRDIMIFSSPSSFPG